MANSGVATKVRQDNDIKITKDYDMFKRIKGNRKLYGKHIKNLTEAFKEKPKKTADVLSYNPILVNDKLEVIDGQHRLEAARKLNLPVYYIVRKNLGLKDIQALNSGTKPWGPMDYAKSYEELGKLDYRMYVDAALYDYPMFNHDVLRFVLSDGKCNYHMFKKGDFQMWNVMNAYDFLKALCDYGKFYPRYTDRQFVMAIFKMFFAKDGTGRPGTRNRNPNYNHEHMLAQLSKDDTVVNDWLETPDYMRELETIYNAGLNDEHKVRFF